MRRLAELKPGERGRILEVIAMAESLAALGFIPGATVRVRQRVRGGPLLVDLGESMYALGREIAAMVAVEPE
ncbi:MAG: FeoA family protein, partial [Armatimonadota bacterium]|nr:FeoA family protein [Armatimonadota bacterium]